MNDKVVDHSTQAINVGSKSFAAAAKLFDERTRQSAVMLYAWCRHCDDVIDGQTLGHGQVEGDRNSGEARLAELVDLTERAYAARVMGAEAEPTLDRACDLGLAFQLTNIARDIVEDAQIGRVYLPAEWLAEVGIPEDEVALPEHRAALATLAARLVDLAEPYYQSASQGLRDLPLRSAWSIATAHGVYRQIGVEVKARGAAAWDARVSTSKAQKLQFLLGGGVLALASRRMQVRPRPDGLWRRPR